MQATLDAASHVIDLARISKAVTTTDRVQAKVVNANITPTNVHPADTRAASAVDQVNDSAVVPLVAEVDLAAAVIWSLTVQQESRDTTDSPSRLTPDSNLKWTKWTVSPDNVQVTIPPRLIHGRPRINKDILLII